MLLLLLLLTEMRRQLGDVVVVVVVVDRDEEAARGECLGAAEAAGVAPRSQTSTHLGARRRWPRRR